MESTNRGIMLRLMLIFSFLVPALLLNSVGVVILNLINHMHVTKGAASWLEAYKDGSIIIGAFVLASFIPSIGYKKSLIIGICCEAAGCFLMWLYPSFIMSHVFFVLCGVGFALIKSTTYATVGLITDDTSQHASNISLLEGLFMLGVLSGFWVYGFFMQYFTWTTTFLFLGIICILNLLVVFITRLDESSIQKSRVSPKDEIKQDIKNMAALFIELFVWIFIILVFAYVFIEQGIVTWLPTFNNDVLHISPDISVKIASLFAGALALGRLVGALFMRKIKWIYVLLFGLAAGFIFLAISIYLASHLSYSGNVVIKSWSDLPFVVYLIPCAGFFVAPVYPTICSTILSLHSARKQSAVAGLILLFSALGGTIGSRVVGSLFGIFGGLTAIKAPLVPMIVIFAILIPYYMAIKKKKQKNNLEEKIQ